MSNQPEIMMSVETDADGVPMLVTKTVTRVDASRGWYNDPVELSRCRATAHCVDYLRGVLRKLENARDAAHDAGVIIDDRSPGAWGTARSPIGDAAP